MQIFEYPYVIITILVAFVLVLGAIGVYFAIRGVKTAEGTDEKEILSVNRLQNNFEKAGKERAERCILYVGISMESFLGLHSKAQAISVFSELKTALLGFFADDKNCNIAEYGETNFIVFQKKSEDSVRASIENCLSELNKCLLKHSALKMVDIRIGAYFALGTQVRFDDAINRARQAYTLANTKKISCAEWDVSSGKALEKKIKIENNIEREIDNNRFFLEYQPVLDAKDKKIIGAEVLARLNSESDGVLTPGSFLSAVDSVGVSDKFDYYIFEKNCKWISNDKKQREGYMYAINFSRSTLCGADFAEKILDIARKYNLKSSCLAIEILEDKNITGRERKQMVSNLLKLKEQGVSILLDDFGSGYTTFSDLQNLDISVVKIDKSITHCAVTDTGFIILQNIIKTANGIGFKTLCEGIETKEQEQAVVKAGCDYLQGFYYYKPMSVAKLEETFDVNSGGV